MVCKTKNKLTKKLTKKLKTIKQGGGALTFYKKKKENYLRWLCPK